MRAAPDRPAVVHDWRCPPSQQVVVETVVRDSTGQAVHVHQCQQCGGDDRPSEVPR